MTERIFRCKRIKSPGDGGMVDGCGWQGYESALEVSPVKFVGSPAARYCPQCGSDRVRELKLGSATLTAPVDLVAFSLPEPKRGLVGWENNHDDECQISDTNPCTCAPNQGVAWPCTPWHACVVTFVVRNVDSAQDINLHPELPKGWLLVSSERMGASKYYLEFEVDGLVNIQDGETVKQIIEELGM